MREEPAHILFLNSRSEYGGADMGLLSLVTHLDPQQFRAIVILPHEGPLVDELRAAGAEILYMDICRLERLASLGQLWAYVRSFVGNVYLLRRLIREKHIDLVYTNSSAIQVGGLVAKLAGIPNVWHIREIWTSPRWLTRPLYRYIYACADRIIVITHAVAMGNFGRMDDKIRLVPVEIEPSRFENLSSRSEGIRQQFGLMEPWPVVVNVARIVPQKGLTSFVEAARLVRDAGVNAYFCIAGDIPRPMYQGYKEQLQQMIMQHNLSDRVFLLGWVKDVPALLHASDVLVLSSIGPEGAGRVIPEAWLSGLPVIVPDHTGPKETVQDGRNGLLFRAGDAQDLCEKIVSLLRDPERRRELAEQGRQDALTYHDARRNAAMIQEILSELLHSRRKA